MDQVFMVALAIVSLAVVAVLIINGKQTAAVITASANAFTSSLKAAINPMQAK